jgi:hypothetical protein
MTTDSLVIAIRNCGCSNNLHTFIISFSALNRVLALGVVPTVTLVRIQQHHRRFDIFRLFCLLDSEGTFLSRKYDPNTDRIYAELRTVCFRSLCRTAE